MKYFKYLDKEKGVSFDIPIFNVDDVEDLRVNHRGDLYEAILHAAIMLHARGYETVPCFIINEDVCSIERETVKGNLDLCEDYYNEIEQYETSSEIKNLKKLLKV